MAGLSDQLGVSSCPHQYTRRQLRHGNDTTTAIAIAVLAFVLADSAHEVIGPGLGYPLASARSGIFTTTRLIATLHPSRSGANLFALSGLFEDLLVCRSAFARTCQFR